MKPFLISAVSLALCLLLGTPIYATTSSSPTQNTSPNVTTLTCYYCPEPTASAQCSDTKVCKGKETYCLITAESSNVGFPFDGTEEVTRDCGTFSACALQSDDEDLGDTTTVICCNKPFCNYMGLSVNSSAIVARPEIGMYAVGISVALITIRP
ncbi:ly6/PLAUR domain-containing protein 2-like isoform X2 [Pseudophryne corroboree]|uniref:ly6/PLAUR domain-containing protein 2-like isoform X2 n=1 Tax=Pseudophryne corroboree TaxID=495146 RepID=UPI003081B128